MTRDEFARKARRVMLGWLIETWGARKMRPSDFGAFADGQIIELDRLIAELRVAEETKLAAANGPAQTTTRTK